LVFTFLILTRGVGVAQPLFTQLYGLNFPVAIIIRDYINSVTINSVTR